MNKVAIRIRFLISFVVPLFYKYFDDDGSRVLPKIFVKEWYNKKYQKSYSNRDFVQKNDHIKDIIIHRKYSGRKGKATGYVLITGSTYRDAEGSPHQRSCLHDTIINAARRIEKKRQIRII